MMTKYKIVSFTTTTITTSCYTTIFARENFIFLLFSCLLSELLCSRKCLLRENKKYSVFSIMQFIVDWQRILTTPKIKKRNRQIYFHEAKWEIFTTSIHWMKEEKKVELRKKKTTKKKFKENIPSLIFQWETICIDVILKRKEVKNWRTMFIKYKSNKKIYIHF